MYDLKALGAYWLLKRMHWTVATRLSEERLGFPLFTDKREWIRARNRAEKLISGGILKASQFP